MASDYQTSPCKGCGKPIVWGVLDGLKRIPLDPAPPVYRVMKRYRAPGGERVIVDRDSTGTMVSHLVTCPAANDFSGKIRKD